MKVSTTGSSRSRVTTTTLSEINVTPLVDVMLVLLIVFMISAPLMQQGMQVNLPKANTGTLNEAPEQVILKVTGSKAIELDGKAVPPGQLAKRLLQISSRKPDVQVFVHADSSIPYGYVAQVVAEVKKARIHSVGLVTQPATGDEGNL